MLPIDLPFFYFSRESQVLQQIQVNVMPHYATTHNASGEAVFSNKVPLETISRSFGDSPSSQAILSSTHSFPADPSTDADLEQYNHDRENGFAGGAICPPNGTAASIVSLAPGDQSPMHRTMTMDTVYVIEGVVEIRLDSGEKQTLKAGDSVVQRATMHQWVNVTPNGGWVRMIGFSSGIAGPVKVGGKELGTEFRF